MWAPTNVRSCRIVFAFFAGGFVDRLSQVPVMVASHVGRSLLALSVMASTTACTPWASGRPAGPGARPVGLTLMPATTVRPDEEALNPALGTAGT